MPIPKKKPFLNKEVNENKFSDFESDMLDIDDLDLENIDLEDDEDDFIDLPKSTTNDNDAENNEKIDSTADEVIDESENKPVQKSTSEDKGILISYSSRAFKDGYRFNSLSLEEQRMTRYLYTSEDSLSSFYLATQRVEEMNAYPDEKFHFVYSLGMPNDGWHLGHIIGCKRSENKLNSYTLKILVSETDVRCFSFTPGLLDPVSVAITRDLDIRNNVFRRADYNELYGCVALFKIKNVETNTGGMFSNIVDFHFLTITEMKVVNKMIDTMLNQS